MPQGHATTSATTTPPVISAAVAPTSTPSPRVPAQPSRPHAARPPLRYAGRRERHAVCIGRALLAANICMSVCALAFTAITLAAMTAPPHWTVWLLPIIFASHAAIIFSVVHRVHRRQRDLGGTARSLFRAWREVNPACTLPHTVSMLYPLWAGVAPDVSTAQLWATCAFAIIAPAVAVLSVRADATAVGRQTARESASPRGGSGPLVP